MAEKLTVAPVLTIRVTERKGKRYFLYLPGPGRKGEKLSRRLYAPRKSLHEKVEVLRGKKLVRNLQINHDWDGKSARFIDRDKDIDLGPTESGHGRYLKYKEVGVWLTPGRFKKGDVIRVTAILNHSIPGEAYDPKPSFASGIWKLMTDKPDGARSNAYKVIPLYGESW